MAASDMFILKKRMQYSAYDYIKIFSGYSNLAKMPEKSTASGTGTDSHRMKPPNILAYCSEKQYLCPERCLTSAVESCLMKHRYVVYPITHDKIFQDPWMENCELLILPLLAHENGISDLLKNFISKGGKVLNFCGIVAQRFGLNVAPIDTNAGSVNSCLNLLVEEKVISYQYSEGDILQFFKTASNCESIIECEDNGERCNRIVAFKQADGLIVHCSLPILQHCSRKQCFEHDQPMLDVIKLLLSKLNMETAHYDDTQDHFVPSCLFCFDEKCMSQFIDDVKIMTSGSTIKGNTLHLDFLEFSKADAEVTMKNKNHVSVLYSPSNEDLKLSCKFNWDLYRRTLDTRMFGKVVLYSDIVTSTMDVAEALLSRLYNVNSFSVTCVARQQTKGQGRGRNKWLSPPGTAMMTMSFTLPLKSFLGERLPILQHIMTVAVVHSIRSIPELKDLPLGVKWPNDIYFGSSVKIGGVLVRSTIYRDIFVATIGCGVNVDNPHPTKCINELIRLAGKTVSLTCEEVLALTLSEFERLVHEFQRKGPKSFVSLYYKYWIHSGQRVKVQVVGDYIDAEVIGIDEFGFLQVLDCKVDPTSGNVITLQPDDNSFDMMKNMIVMKK